MYKNRIKDNPRKFRDGNYLTDPFPVREIVRMRLFEMAANGRLHCERCGGPLLDKGHSDDDWIAAGVNPDKTCFRCRLGMEK